MSDKAIHLSVDTSLDSLSGLGIQCSEGAAIAFFEQNILSNSPHSVQFNFLDGLESIPVPISRNSAEPLSCISSECISDPVLFESGSSLASVDPGLLATTLPATNFEQVRMDSPSSTLNTDLSVSLSRVQMALAGETTADELTHMIENIQSQLLDLNSLSQTLFGDLSEELGQASQQLGNEQLSSLLDSIQSSSLVLADSGLFDGFSTTAAPLEPTLDGLFTSPEAFPLTLDFSSPDSVQEASQLFAHAGNTSSINSTATSEDSGAGSSASQGFHFPDYS